MPFIIGSNCHYRFGDKINLERVRCVEYIFCEGRGNDWGLLRPKAIPVNIHLVSAEEYSFNPTHNHSDACPYNLCRSRNRVYRLNHICSMVFLRIDDDLVQLRRTNNSSLSLSLDCSKTLETDSVASSLVVAHEEESLSVQTVGSRKTS